MGLIEPTGILSKPIYLIDRSIEMPRLDRGLIVLEDNFNVVMKSCWNDRGAKLCGSARSWCVLDGIQIEDAGNVKPVGKLQWGGRVRIGDRSLSFSSGSTSEKKKLCYYI